MSRETIVTCNNCWKKIGAGYRSSPPAGNHLQLAGVRWLDETMDFCCWTCFYEWVTKHHNETESKAEAQRLGT